MTILIMDWIELDFIYKTDNLDALGLFGFALLST